MADKSINQLPVSDGLTDDGLLVVYQDGETKSITGNLIKQFAEQGIESALEDAKASGEFDGKDGEDAVSPTIAVSDITGGHRITITDKNGIQTVDVMDGTDGEDGYTPQKGKDYTDGKDGVSPTVSVADITDGHRLTITDVNGSKTVDIMDGTDGNDGVSIQSIERTAGTGAAGTTDTYTVTLTDGSKTQFQVYNGKDGAGSGDMTAAVYDPQGKAQDVFAYADMKLPLAGGTMTGPIKLDPSKAYIGVISGSVSTFTNPKLFNVYTIDTIGTIAINVGKGSSFLALDFSAVSYNMVMDLKFGGYTYTSSTFFHSPMVGGAFNGFGNYGNVEARIRAAVDNEGNRYFLIGDVDTNWGGYIRGAVTKLIRMGGTAVPDVDIQLITDESHITWQQVLPLRSSVPVEVDLLNKAVPIEKGGTGAASAADARTALGVPSTDEMNTAISTATANAVTTDEMNTAIDNAIGTALEASY